MEIKPACQCVVQVFTSNNNKRISYMNSCSFYAYFNFIALLPRWQKFCIFPFLWKCFVLSTSYSEIKSHPAELLISLQLVNAKNTLKSKKKKCKPAFQNVPFLSLYLTLRLFLQLWRFCVIISVVHVRVNILSA